MNDHLELTLRRSLSLADIAAHSDVQQDCPLSHRPESGRDVPPHDWPPVDPPEIPPATTAFILIPGKFILYRSPAKIADVSVHHTVLVAILGIEMTPMQAGMIRRFSVPALTNIDLSFIRPLEGLARQEPERRPDPRGRWHCKHCGQAATGSIKALAGY
jgi:hypothetical protein